MLYIIYYIILYYIILYTFYVSVEICAVSAALSYISFAII